MCWMLFLLSYEFQLLIYVPLSLVYKLPNEELSCVFMSSNLVMYEYNLNNQCNLVKKRPNAIFKSVSRGWVLISWQVDRFKVFFFSCAFLSFQCPFMHTGFYSDEILSMYQLLFYRC